MKSTRKTLHEFTSHISQKTPKRNKNTRTSTNEMLRTDIIASTLYSSASIHSEIHSRAPSM
jgi:hypothetical protein